LDFDEEKNKFTICNYVGGEKKGRGVSFVFRGPHKGHIFEGDFSGDLYGGIGSYKWPGEDVYVGGFVDGLRSGWGVLSQPSENETYCGQLYQNQR
jgi:hypothetical protein